MKAVNSSKYLFTSATRFLLIQKLFYFPLEMYYVRQLTRNLKLQINALRRELSHLEQAGLISKEQRSNRLYYLANPNSPLYFDLICLAHKTSNLGECLYKKQNQLGELKQVFYSRNFLLNQPRSGSYEQIDIILVGKFILQELESLINAEQILRGYEINYMVMDENELQLRKQRRDPFIIDFFLQMPILIFGQI